MRWIDRIPLGILMAGGVLMAMLPWPRQPLPHLLEKLGMLVNLELTRPIDIFDLFLHGTLITLLIIRLIRMALGLTAVDHNGAGNQSHGE